MPRKTEETATAADHVRVLSKVAEIAQRVNNIVLQKVCDNVVIRWRCKYTRRGAPSHDLTQASRVVREASAYKELLDLDTHRSDASIGRIDSSSSCALVQEVVLRS